jgi:hypothetical protein
MKTLKNYVKFSNCIKIIIPSQQKNGAEIENLAELRAEVQNALTDLCGGATLSSAVGTYRLETGVIQREGVNICESYTDILTEQKTEAVIEVCETLKLKANQESIALNINGELYFI